MVLFRRKLAHLQGPHTLCSDDPLWQALLTPPPLPEEVFAIPASYIRTLLNENAANVYRLTRYLTIHILVHLAPAVGTKPPASLLGAVRLLTRIVPILHESGDQDDQLYRLFWSRTGLANYIPGTEEFPSPSSSKATVGVESSASGVSDVCTENASTEVRIYDPTKPDALDSSRAVTSSAPSIPPLGVQLVRACVDLLFLPGFTIDDSLVPYWEPGVRTKGNYNTAPSALLKPRIELLRFLVALCSEPLHQASQTTVSLGSNFLTTLTAAVSPSKLPVFLFSLLNTNLKEVHCPAQSELQALCTSYSSYLLCLCVTYALPTNCSFLEGCLVYAGLGKNNKPSNTVRASLARLLKPDELYHIASSLVLQVLQPLKREKARRYTAKTSSFGIAASILLLWELVQCNQRFANHLAEAKDSQTGEFFSNELCVALLYHAENRDLENAEVSRVASYFLVKLTTLPSASSRLLNNFSLRFHEYCVPSRLFKLESLQNALIVTYRDFLVYKLAFSLLHRRNLEQDRLFMTYVEMLYNTVPLSVKEAPLAQSKGLDAKGGLTYRCCSILTQLVALLGRCLDILDSDGLSLLLKSIVANLRSNHPQQTRILASVIVLNQNTFTTIAERLQSISEGPIGTENEYRATRPVGMSQKAKDKAPIGVPLSRTFSGREELNIILKLTKETRNTIHEFQEKGKVDLNRMNVLIQKLEDADIISKVVDEGLMFKPLRFIWSKVSLGWYLGVLWADIYDLERKVSWDSSQSLGSGFQFFGNFNAPEIEAFRIERGLFDDTSITLFELKDDEEPRSMEIVDNIESGGLLDSMASNLMKQISYFTGSLNV